MWGNNMENKELVEYKEGFFTKIKNKILNMFKKQNKENVNSSVVSKEENSSFTAAIKVEENEEKSRILKLQKAYQRGAILEEEIKEDDYKKLVELYEEQNRELEEKINQKKEELKKLIYGLKVS